MLPALEIHIFARYLHHYDIPRLIIATVAQICCNRFIIDVSARLINSLGRAGLTANFIAWTILRLIKRFTRSINHASRFI